MSPRSLLLVGVVWFLGAAGFGIYLSRTSFAIGWVIKGPVSNAASLAAIWLVFICTALLLIGWMIPVGIGLYRLLRH